jgi:hypothetical protein
MSQYENESRNLMSFAFGAAVGVAAILFLDRDMRAKVVNKLMEARDMGEEQIEAAKNKAVQARDTLAAKTDELLLDAHERLSEDTANAKAKPAPKKS